MKYTTVAVIAMMASPPTETPTPMPIFAPWLRPDEAAAVAEELELAEDEAAVEVVEEVVEEDVVEDAVEVVVEVVDDMAAFVTILNPRLCNRPLTNPFPVPVFPLGSSITRT
jgi:hypothetical protein